MRKIWGILANFIKSNKRKVVLIFLAVLSVFLLLYVLSDKGVVKVKSAERSKEAEIQKEIAENKEKYAPKYDWLTQNPQNLPLSTKAAMILDYNTGEVLLAQNEKTRLYPASITKILTASVVLENMATDKLCDISQKVAETEPNKIVMKAGEKMKVEDLLYGLMMISANDAAEALAECYDGGREAFMAKMNEKVKSLGLTETHFVNPSGLHDDNHYTTAYDMTVITNYAIKSNPEFLKYFGRKDDYSVFPTETNESHWWQQISNLLQTYQGMDGAKTGFTYEAGNTYVGTAKRGSRRVIIVYLGANSTTYDATTMLDQAFYLDPSKK